MVALCRKHQILSHVDAAHAIGQIDIDIASVQPDFFVYASLCQRSQITEGSLLIAQIATNGSTPITAALYSMSLHSMLLRL